MRMERLLLVALAGFAASLVDGALGMGFGPTSSTFLYLAGVAPVAASFTINLAKVATGAAGGFAHWKFGNLHRTIVWRLAVPGCIGAILGVGALSRIHSDDLKPVLAGLLCLVALRMLYRFVKGPTRSALITEIEANHHGRHRGSHADMPASELRMMSAAALIGGVTNGLVGAWGPVVTPAVMQSQSVEPRVAIGSTNIAEIAVAAVTSIALISSRGVSEVDPRLLVALLIGGVIAAPAAAWAVKVIPANSLGVAVGLLLLLTNAGTVAEAVDVPAVMWGAYSIAGFSVGLAVCRMRRRSLDARAAAVDEASVR